jgi:hypothetical protein
MNKPDIEQVIELARMKEEAKALYDEIDSMTLRLMEQFGPGRFDYDLEEAFARAATIRPVEVGTFEESLIANGRYLKLEITDNIEAMKAGEVVWKSVAFKAADAKTQSLKRRPDSLK